MPEENSTNQNETDNIELRSEEVQEILSHIPYWIVRWGITLIFAIILVVLVISWFIKYPDVVPARVVLTTEEPPVRIIAKASGNIDFFIKDNEIVNKGDSLGIIDNSANIKDIFYLDRKLKQFKPYIYKKNIPNNIENFKENLDLGELQNSYLSFLKGLNEDSLFQNLNYHGKQEKAIKDRIKFLEALNKQLEKQKKIQRQELKLAQKRYDADSVLFINNAIAEVEFIQTQNNYLQVKRAYELAEANIINNQIQISQLATQIMELSLDEKERKEGLNTTIETSFKNLESQLEAWKKQYLLVAPISGKVTMTKYWSDNQFVGSGEEIVTIIPDNNKLFGFMQVPVSGSGKVEIGQKVNIKFDNYPSNEYGMISGEVKSISLVPKDNLYVIRVSLPEGLTTSYNKELEFRQEMQGSADIITDDLRLLQRIFNQLRALMDNASK